MQTNINTDCSTKSKDNKQDSQSEDFYSSNEYFERQSNYQKFIGNNNFREVVKDRFFAIASDSSYADEFQTTVQNTVYFSCPDSLFRYRSCDANNYNISSVLNSTVYMASPKEQNDPYDNLIMYQQNDNLFQPLYCHKAACIANKSIGMHHQNIEHTIKTMQGSMLISCYTETHTSTLMWAHYADNHKGFVLEYSKQDIINSKVALFPILYSKQRYDASKAIDKFSIRRMAILHGFTGSKSLPEASRYLIQCGISADKTRISLDDSDYERIITCMVKSEHWSYEKEWRQILVNDCNNMVHIAPKAIYYGNKISAANRAILHDIAVKKGIKEYDMEIDYSSPNFEIRSKPVK